MIRLPLKVQVTAEDIAQGIRRVACFCPMADAIARAAGTPCTVGLADFCFYDVKPMLKFKLPRIARDFIRNFDDMGPSAVQPIEWAIQEADRL